MDDLKKGADELKGEDPELAALLDLAPSQPASDGLKRRIMDDFMTTAQNYDPVGISVSPRLGVGEIMQQIASLFGGRVFAPAGIAAAIAACGFFIGVITAPQNEEALYYADAALAGAFVTSEEDVLWAVD